MASASRARCFAIATALVLTLLLRRAANRATDRIADLAGDYRLRSALASRSAYLLSDFMTPGAYGGLAKIDHALLTPAGVICIRAIHRQGTVHGAADDAQWHQVIGGQRRRFLNPLIQNEGRLRGLSSAIPQIPMASLVVFTGSPRFRSETASNVVTPSELAAWIDRYTFGPDAIDDLDATWQRLNQVAITDEDSRRDYEAQIGFC